MLIARGLKNIDMIERVVKLSCDWCGDYTETSIKGIGLKNLLKRSKKRGWLVIKDDSGGDLHFCSEKCLAEDERVNKVFTKKPINPNPCKQ